MPSYHWLRHVLWCYYYFINWNLLIQLTKISYISSVLIKNDRNLNLLSKSKQTKPDEPKEIDVVEALFNSGYWPEHGVIHQQSGNKRNLKIPNVNPTGSSLKICQYCQKNEDIFEGACSECLPFKWNCPYLLCGKANYGKGDRYCKHCGIDRCKNVVIGESIGQFYHGTIRQVLLCHECLRINEVSKKKCSNCKAEKIANLTWCRHCGHGNTGFYKRHIFGMCSKCGLTL